MLMQRYENIGIWESTSSTFLPDRQQVVAFVASQWKSESITMKKNIEFQSRVRDKLLYLQILGDCSPNSNDKVWKQKVMRIVVATDSYKGCLSSVQAGTAMAEGILKTGLVAQAAGFDIYLSNNCVSVNSNSTDTYTIVGGVDSAATYAEQIVSTEAYRPEKRFADAVKGLHVYGAKVVDKAQLACLKATFA